jgi:uncharacterized membrane protein YdjX (TVP38/TMEM64 family)
MSQKRLSLSNHWIRLVLTGVLVALVIVAYNWGGLRESADRLRGLDHGASTAILIVLAMAFAWAFALPASAFLFITPLLFPPHVSAAVTTAGCALGTAVGYLVARFIGGPWVDRFRDGRLRRFLERHSSFLVFFGIRLTPSSPHGFINYAAGLAAVPFGRFVAATTAAMAIKSYVYAAAVHNTVGASSLTDALSARTLASLFAVALLAIVGHVIKRRFFSEQVQDPVTVEPAISPTEEEDQWLASSASPLHRTHRGQT